MILDACCGTKIMYHGREEILGDELISIDIRKEEETIIGTRKGNIKRIRSVKPTVMADMKHLPFKDSVFEAVIFDPPFLDLSLSRFFRNMYGSWTEKETIQHLRAVNIEFKRVLQQEGILMLKVFKKRFQLYEALLTNFSFFLPIEYKSKSNLSSEVTGWYIATLKAEPQTVSLLHDTQTQPSQAQLASEQQ